MIQSTYTADEMMREAKRQAQKLIKTHIERKLSANDIKTKSEIWYFAQSVITSVDEDRS